MRTMKHRYNIIAIVLLILSGCNSRHDINFVKKYPDFEYVNDKRSTEFLERWGDSPPDKPAICPILSKIKNFQDFKIDSTKNEAYLDVLNDNKRNTIVFP